MAEANKEFTFFWKNHSPFSQWHKSNFTIDDMTFNCAEQYMMYQKAGLWMYSLGNTLIINGDYSQAVFCIL